MTDTQKAMFVYRNCNILNPSAIRGNLKPVIKSLQENEKREKGCELCKIKHLLHGNISFRETDNLVTRSMDGDYKIGLITGNAKPSTERKAKFCPECGKKLEEDK